MYPWNSKINLGPGGNEHLFLKSSKKLGETGSSPKALTPGLSPLAAFPHLLEILPFLHAELQTHFWVNIRCKDWVREFRVFFLCCELIHPSGYAKLGIIQVSTAAPEIPLAIHPRRLSPVLPEEEQGSGYSTEQSIRKTISFFSFLPHKSPLPESRSKLCSLIAGCQTQVCLPDQYNEEWQ